MNNEQFIEVFQQNYNRVFNYMGGGDLKLLISLACKYTLAEKQFSGVQLQKVCEQLEEAGKGTFSIPKYSTVNVRLASYLIVEGKLDKTISEIMTNDQLLKEAKFNKSPFRGIGALFLQEDKQQHAERARTLYVEMKRRQRILTSNGDIPYIVYLTTDQVNDPVTQAQTIYQYYDVLRKQKWIMGNDLQALAQIMTMYSSEYNEVLLQYILQLKIELEKTGIKVKKAHYPFLGVLALAATNASKIESIVQLHNQLLELKVFKAVKYYALIVAIQKIIRDTQEVQEIINFSPISNLTKLVDLLDVADILVEIGRILPGGISEVTDFFN